MANCIDCKNFQLVYGTQDGICSKGHGYTHKTFQGLPEPEEGTGYVFKYDIACKNDFMGVR